MTSVVPVAPDRWPLLKSLFGPNGAYANCWCMWWRLPAKAFDAGVTGGNQAAMQALVEDGREPGLLAVDDSGAPMGWVSVAPRGEFGRVERSPVLKPVDDRPAWSVVCFYIPRSQRGQGVGQALLAGAVEHCRNRGASLVEGYPVDPSRKSFNAAGLYTGTVGMFSKAGFTEVARRKPDGRVIMRLKLSADT